MLGSRAGVTVKFSIGHTSCDASDRLSAKINFLTDTIFADLDETLGPVRLHLLVRKNSFHVLLLYGSGTVVQSCLASTPRDGPTCKPLVVVAKVDGSVLEVGFSLLC